MSHCALVGALRDTLSARLTDLGMDQLYRDIELPLCPVLAEMEQAGFLIDRGALARFGQVLADGIAQSEQAIYALAGEDTFNINSTQQLGISSSRSWACPR